MINEEILDSELDSVAGGTFKQVIDDIVEMKRLGIAEKDVQTVFKKFGVEVEIHPIIGYSKFKWANYGPDANHDEVMDLIRREYGTKGNDPGNPRR